MAVPKLQKVWPQNLWLSAAGLLTVLLWTAQFAADWFVPHSNIGIAELDKIELASVIHPERTDSSRDLRLESKSDPAANAPGWFAIDAVIAGRNHPLFAAESAHHRLAVALPGIRAPPHYFFSA